MSQSVAKSKDDGQHTCQKASGQVVYLLMPISDVDSLTGAVGNGYPTLIACGQGHFFEALSAKDLGPCARETHIRRKWSRTTGADVWARGWSSARRGLSIDCRRGSSSGELGIDRDRRGKILVLRIIVRPSRSLEIQRWDMVLAAQST